MGGGEETDYLRSILTESASVQVGTERKLETFLDWMCIFEDLAFLFVCIGKTNKEHFIIKGEK